MRFYEGHIYSLSSAVWPETQDFYCEFLHISSPKTAYIGYGYDRYFEVGSASKMILHFKTDNGKFNRKIRNIPFENVEGRMVFDYPAFLGTLGIKYKLYKRCDFYGADDSNYHMIYCKNAEITSGSYREIDYTVYWLGVNYRQPLLYLDGKKVTYIQVNSTRPFTEQAEAFVKEHLEEKRELSYTEFSEICSRFKVRPDSHDNQIRFSDGTIIYGKEIGENIIKAAEVKNVS